MQSIRDEIVLQYLSLTTHNQSVEDIEDSYGDPKVDTAGQLSISWEMPNLRIWAYFCAWLKWAFARSSGSLRPYLVADCDWKTIQCIGHLIRYEGVAVEDVQDLRACDWSSPYGTNLVRKRQEPIVYNDCWFKYVSRINFMIKTTDVLSVASSI